NPDEEIRALYDFEPAQTEVIDREWAEKVGSTQAEYPSVDPAVDNVKLVYYQPNHLKYEYTASASRPLVFSEVYYKTWKAFVDGDEVPLYRVDYILRGITAPQGRHTVELKCRNEIKAKSGILTNIGSGLNVAAMLLIIAMLIYRACPRKKE
ncbi:MAG: YfhO family protein, partial [Bacteroidales bacterium]|nr:YfhO family protein [Bacteroidales bacterium]